MDECVQHGSQGSCGDPHITRASDGSAAHLTSWCKEDQYPKVDRLNDIAGMMLKAQVAGLPTAAGASCPP